MLIRCFSQCEPRIRSLVPNFVRSTRGYKIELPEFTESELKDSSKMIHIDRDKRVYLKPGDVYRRRKESRLQKKIKSSRCVQDKFSSGTTRSLINPMLMSVLENEVETSPTVAESVKSSKVSSSDLQSSIENFRPVELTIGSEKFDKIAKSLSKAFKKAQLKEYADEMKKKPEFLHVTYRWDKNHRLTKPGIIDTILLDFWKLQTVDRILATDVLEKRVIQLNESQLHLLDLEKSFVFEELKRLRINAQLKGNTLYMSGTEANLAISEGTIDEFFASITCKEIDISYAAQQYTQTGRHELPLKDIQETTNVYFEHVEGGKYIIHATKKHAIDLAKQLLIWALDFNPHVVNEVFNKQELSLRKFIPINTGENLASVERFSNSYYQQIKDLKTPHNPILLSKLVKMNDQLMSSNVLTDLVNQKLKTKEDFEIDEALSALTNIGSLITNTTNEVEQDTEDFNQLKSSQSEDIQEISQESETTTESSVEFDDISNNAVEKSTLPEELSNFFSESTIDEVYNQLNDTTYTSELNGVPEEAIMSTAIAAQFGNILLKTKKSELLFPTFEQVNEQSEFKFVTNGVPYINDIVTSLPLASDPRGLPYTTKIQLRFTPSLFGASSEIKEYMKYPPVEIQGDLNEYGVPQTETVLLYSAEAVKNIAIPLPNSASDVQLSKIIAGDLLNTQVGYQETGKDEEILKQYRISNNFERFKSQPGLFEFLEESTLNFTGKDKVYVRPYIDIYINGEKVRYDFVNMTHRMEIPFIFKDRIITLAIIEGGEFGGHRTEIIMGEGELSKQEFKSFLADVAQLLNIAS